MQNRKADDPAPPVDERVYVPGFLGKPKGLKQILWERRMWKDGMIMHKTEKELAKLRLDGKKLPDPDLFADYKLFKCSDFAEEKSQLANLIESRGHILLLGVKCHPEMAGVGVEYVFGYSKKYFRKHNNCKVVDLEKNVRRSLAPDVITMPRLWKFARRTWMYQEMYLEIYRNGEDANITFESLEKTMRDRKTTHRNIMENENTYLNSV